MTADTAPQPTLPTLDEARNAAERDAILRTLAHTDRNISRTARILAVSRMTLYRLMEKHGITNGTPLPDLATGTALDLAADQEWLYRALDDDEGVIHRGTLTEVFGLYCQIRREDNITNRHLIAHIEFLEPIPAAPAKSAVN